MYIHLMKVEFFYHFYFPFAGVMYFAGNLLGANESSRPGIFQRWINGESQQLLQDVHHVDEREDPKDLCREKHVRVQTHQKL